MLVISRINFRSFTWQKQRKRQIRVLRKKFRFFHSFIHDHVFTCCTYIFIFSSNPLLFFLTNKYSHSERNQKLALKSLFQIFSNEEVSAFFDQEEFFKNTLCHGSREYLKCVPRGGCFLNLQQLVYTLRVMCLKYDPQHISVPLRCFARKFQIISEKSREKKKFETQ